METIGERIRYHRDKMGYSAAELGERVGVSQSYISHFENNRRVPSKRILVKLAEVLKVSVEDINPNITNLENEYSDININLPENRFPSFRREDGSISITIGNATVSVFVKAKPRDKVDKEDFRIMINITRLLETAIEQAVVDVLENNQSDILDITLERFHKLKSRWEQQLLFADEIINDIQVLKEVSDKSDED